MNVIGESCIASCSKWLPFLRDKLASVNYEQENQTNNDTDCQIDTEEEVSGNTIQTDNISMVSREDTLSINGLLARTGFV